MAKAIGLIRFIHFELIIISVAVTLSFIIAVTGDSWWVLQSMIYAKEDTDGILLTKNNIGLWKFCVYGTNNVEYCHNYGNILNFNDENLTVGEFLPISGNRKVLDVMLLLLIWCALSSFLSLGLLIQMFRTINDIVLWKKLSYLTLVSYLTTFIFGTAASIYGEMAFHQNFHVSVFNNNAYTHGWCLVMSFCCSVISFLFLPVILLIQNKMNIAHRSVEK